MRQDDDKKVEWYTLSGRLATLAALAFLYAYWDRIPEKAVALSLFAGFFVIPLLAVEVAIHFYLRKPQRQGQTTPERSGRICSLCAPCFSVRRVLLDPQA